MPTILLVDNDDGVREVIFDHLSAAGFDVIAVPDTLMARCELDAHPWTDLCLVDLVMPSGVPDGPAFARSVRSENPDMPVFLMTGYYTAAVRAGDIATRLIYKPIDMDKLVAEIKRQLTA